jgi:hypothetical protein
MRLQPTSTARLAGPLMKRPFDTETTIILLAVGVVYLGYLRIIDWMPELGVLGNLLTGDVSVCAGLEIKCHAILLLCTLALCWAVGLKTRRASQQRSARHGLSRHRL